MTEMHCHCQNPQKILLISHHRSPQKYQKIQLTLERFENTKQLQVVSKHMLICMDPFKKNYLTLETLKINIIMYRCRIEAELTCWPGELWDSHQTLQTR